MTEFQRSKKIAISAYNVIKSRTEEEVEVLDVSEITSLADIFIIVTAQNTRAVAGLAHEIEKKLQEEDYNVVGKEGHNTSRWVLLDFNGVIVHIFHKEEAEFYNLDELWSDGKTMELDAK